MSETADQLLARLTKALDESDLMGCGCCGGGYDYDKYESREEAVVAFLLEQLMPRLIPSWVFTVPTEQPWETTLSDGDGDLG